MAGAVRRDGESVLNSQRLGDVALQPEAVRFRVGDRRKIGGRNIVPSDTSVTAATPSDLAKTSTPCFHTAS